MRMHVYDLSTTCSHVPPRLDMQHSINYNHDISYVTVDISYVTVDSLTPDVTAVTRQLHMF